MLLLLLLLNGDDDVATFWWKDVLLWMFLVEVEVVVFMLVLDRREVDDMVYK